MNILITGGCGFIGTNFILEQIKSTQNEILNIDKLTYAGNQDNLKSLKHNERYSFFEGDICDTQLVYNYIHDFRPQVIIHFAAESHVDRSIDDPLSFVQTNVHGTASLLHCANKYFIKYKSEIKTEFKFIHISTDEVYGSIDGDGRFNENSIYKPNSPYSASKAGSDHLVRAWAKTYKLPTITTNCSNNYGPYQYPEKLIPLIITNCIDQKPLPIYGDGQNIRDWIYVNDHCKAISSIIGKNDLTGKFNIGGNCELKNIDVVMSICKIMDKLLPLNNSKSYMDKIKFVKDRPGHDYRYAIDASKIKKATNWKPREDFDSGIEKTINWYLNNEDWWRKLKK